MKYEGERMYAFIQYVPIDSTFYKRIADGIGTELPRGLIIHLATERPEGGLQYVDVWESQEDWERFVEERLHPVVHTLLSEVFGDALPPEPDRTVLGNVHQWGSAMSPTRQ